MTRDRQIQQNRDSFLAQVDHWLDTKIAEGELWEEDRDATMNICAGVRADWPEYEDEDGEEESGMTSVTKANMRFTPRSRRTKPIPTDSTTPASTASNNVGGVTPAIARSNPVFNNCLPARLTLPYMHELADSFQPEQVVIPQELIPLVEQALVRIGLETPREQLDRLRALCERRPGFRLVYLGLLVQAGVPFELPRVANLQAPRQDFAGEGPAQGVANFPKRSNQPELPPDFLDSIDDTNLGLPPKPLGLDDASNYLRTPAQIEANHWLPKRQADPFDSWDENDGSAYEDNSAQVAGNEPQTAERADALKAPCLNSGDIPWESTAHIGADNPLPHTQTGQSNNTRAMESVDRSQPSTSLPQHILEKLAPLPEERHFEATVDISATEGAEMFQPSTSWPRNVVIDSAPPPVEQAGPSNARTNVDTVMSNDEIQKCFDEFNWEGLDGTET
ncbi:MAG: hypothetical protein M1831_000991 [Alyxoria varia]|nr:MAG: hypothetical protein M1831_000991 [Alyxoria varia]